MNAMSETATGTREERILVVDDEKAVRNLYASCLSARSTCVTAGDAQEALVRLASGDFAIVIADVQMPGLSGVELLRLIVEHFPDTAVIIAGPV